MSCLSERERMALEDIFLSISVNQSPFERCKSVCTGYAPRLKEHAKSLIGFVQLRKRLKTYAHTKLFFRQKQQKIQKQLGFLRHK